MKEALLPAVLLSLRSAVLAVLLTAPGAVLFGWLLAKKDFPGKTLLDSLIHIPMVLPPITIGYGLLLLRVQALEDVVCCCHRVRSFVLITDLL